jgi:transcriptional regulator with XRE-family HTH domain
MTKIAIDQVSVHKFAILEGHAADEENCETGAAKISTAGSHQLSSDAGPEAFWRLFLMTISPPGRPRMQDVDFYVGRRIRQRRVMLGLTQHELAKMIGVSVQQAHKYETGINRISAGKLRGLAEALQTDIDYFFDGFNPDDQSLLRETGPSPGRRLFLELSRNFTNIREAKQREALCELARALAKVEVEL